MLKGVVIVEFVVLGERIPIALRLSGRAIIGLIIVYPEPGHYQFNTFYSSINEMK